MFLCSSFTAAATSATADVAAAATFQPYLFQQHSLADAQEIWKQKFICRSGDATELQDY